MLCEYCKAVFLQPVTFVQKQWWKDAWWINVKYGITFAEFEAKTSRCYGCRGLRRAVSKDLGTPEASAPLEVEYLLKLQTDNVDASLCSYVWIDGKKLEMAWMKFQQISTEDHREEISSTNTGSKETLKFIKDSLDSCRQHHSACSASFDAPPWYPTRMIDVGNDNLRLIETAEVKPSKHYASLSHCWGGADILKLTKGNLSSLKKEIQFVQLPKTFQDAIRVVGELGISYIWIDSLCIIQDSTEDWQREAQTMLDVYKHALLNIAATKSTDSLGGLFKDRKPDLVNFDILDMDIKHWKGQYCQVDQRYFDQEVDHAPLNSRAWVTQERILSTRTVHFASEQVFWDCAELTACESLPQGTNIWPLSRSQIGCKQGSMAPAHIHSVDAGLGWWAKIVSAYSACGLTVPGDKFIALSGIVNHLHNELKMEYCAGLWSSRLEVQLAWYVEQCQPNKALRNDLAPSWSWVSVNGSVHMSQPDEYNAYTFTPLISAQFRHFRRLITQHRGEKLIASLEMRCSLNPITIHGTAQNLQMKGNGMEGHVVSVRADDPNIIGAARLFYVPLYEVRLERSLTEKWKVGSQLRGVIVQAVGEQGTYTRCGHASLAADTLEETKAFSEAYEGVKSPKGKSDLPCEEFDENTGHLIILI